MTLKESIDILQRAERYFNTPKYQSALILLRNSLGESRLKDFEHAIRYIPSDDELFTSLVEKLKGKSVYKTLKKVLEGKIDNNYDGLKCLFSLGTHVAIECKQNPEYRALLPRIYEHISKMLFELE